MRGFRAVVVVSVLVALGVAAPGALGWQGKLVVRKVNIGGPAADSFSFSLTKNPNAYVDVWDPAAQEFTLTGAPSAGGPFTEGATQKTFDGLWAGQDVGFNHWVDYTVTEAAKPGYTTSAACSIDDGGLWTTVNQATSQYGQWSATTTTTSTGATAATTSVRWWNDQPYTTTCTFTNVYHRTPSATITLAKVVQPAGAGEFNLTLDGANTTVAGSAGDVTFGNGDQSGANVVAPGDHVVAERAATPGQALTDYTASLACVNRAAQGAAVPVGAGGTIAVHDGDDVLCTFTNVKLPGSGVGPVPPSSGGSSSTSGGGTTGGGTTPGRSSHIVGPSACLSRAEVTVGVRGHGITSVAFSINGRHLRTVTTRNGNGIYALVVRTRTLPRGATIVVARVTFRGSARTRTLRLRLSRCAARSVRPTFTG